MTVFKNETAVKLESSTVVISAIDSGISGFDNNVESVVKAIAEEGRKLKSWFQTCHWSDLLGCYCIEQNFQLRRRSRKDGSLPYLHKLVPIFFNEA